MTKKKAAAWIIVFALLVIGPGIIYHFAEPYINTENTENRQLAEKPVLSRDNLQTFASEYNSYYNDHLAFRSQQRSEYECFPGFLILQRGAGKK